MMHTSDLAFFTLLARQPSLATAAPELGVTPPAVSRRLAQLERRLGVRLLNRTTRRLSLTPEGERYLEDGGRILREIEALEHSLGASREELRGLLRINATFGFGRRAGQLCRVLAPWEGSSADIHAVYPQRHHLSAKVRVFLDFLSQRFSLHRSDSAARPAAW